MLRLAAITIACAATAFGQSAQGVRVLRVSSETADAISFQVSTRKGLYAENENIDVYYVVQNKSRKTVYLITNPATELRIPDSWIVELPDPIDFPDAHYPYRYRMIKLPPGKSYRGKRTIEAKKLNDHPKYGFNVVDIQIGFAYLFDITDLHEWRYSLPCLSKVYEEARIVKLGNLVVERKVE